MHHPPSSEAADSGPKGRGLWAHARDPTEVAWLVFAKPSAVVMVSPRFTWLPPEGGPWMVRWGGVPLAGVWRGTASEVTMRMW